MLLDKFSRYNIKLSGDQRLTVIDYGECHNLPYLSKDEYEELKDPRLIGYASVKRSRIALEEDTYRNPDDIVGLLGVYVKYECDMLLATVRKKKHKFKSVKGYFAVGNNQYVAIERNNLFLFLIPLLLILLIIGFCASCGKFNGTAPEPIDPWQPVIEENLGESPTKPFEQRNIEIFGFSSWHISAGETENLPITLTNPEDNPCYFSFVITLEDSNEELYRSDMVKPSDTIRSIDINRPLEAGQYKASIHILTNELESGATMNDARFEITLTVD